MECQIWFEWTTMSGRAGRMLTAVGVSSGSFRADVILCFASDSAMEVRVSRDCSVHHAPSPTLGIGEVTATTLLLGV